jgi:hypothetical protein
VGSSSGAASEGEGPRGTLAAGGAGAEQGAQALGWGDTDAEKAMMTFSFPTGQFDHEWEEELERREAASKAAIAAAKTFWRHAETKTFSRNPGLGKFGKGVGAGECLDARNPLSLSLSLSLPVCAPSSFLSSLLLCITGRQRTHRRADRPPPASFARLRQRPQAPNPRRSTRDPCHAAQALTGLHALGTPWHLRAVDVV